MSKQKKPAREDRRRQSIEINLLADQEASGGTRVRRGCSLPFIGGALLPVLMQLLLHRPA